jgi:lysophospholipase L1-like esterase
LITLGAAPAVLLALEGGLRLGGFSRPPLSVPIVVWNTAQDAQFDTAGGLHRIDLDTLWSPRPGQRIRPRDEEFINSAGYRGPLLPVERTPGTLRVALVGESNVFGMSMPWDETLAPRLQQRLAEGGQPAEVLNAGVIGFDVCQGVERYRTLVRPHRPDVVFASFGTLNEYAPCSGLPAVEKLAAAQAMRSGWRSTWYRLTTRLRSLQLLSWLRSRADGVDPEEAARNLSARQTLHADPMPVSGQVDWPGCRRVSLDEFEAALVELAREVRADGARLILGAMPRLPSAEQLAPVLELYSQRILAVAAREGLQALDLRGFVNSGAAGVTAKDILLDDWHFNGAGHALCAEQLAPLVLDPAPGR